MTTIWCLHWDSRSIYHNLNANNRKEVVNHNKCLYRKEKTEQCIVEKTSKNYIQVLKVLVSAQGTSGYSRWLEVFQGIACIFLYFV